MPERALGRLRETAAELGAANAVLYGIDRVLGRIHRRLGLDCYYLVAQPVPPRPLLARRGSAGIRIRPLGRDDPLAAAFPRPAAEIAARFDAGAQCLAAVRNDVMIGYIWFVRGPYREPDGSCVLVPAPAATTAWDMDIYIDPAERTGRVFAYLWDAAFGALREQGVRWTLSRISAFNARSLAAHRRLGMRRVGRQVVLRAGNVRLLLATVAPFAHLSPHPRRAPRVVVSAPGR